LRLTGIAFVLLILVQAVYSQGGQPTEWMRVQTNDGEVSFDFPTTYNYFFDKYGFSVSRDSSDYQVEDVTFLRAYQNGTLLAFEVYRANTDAVDALMSRPYREGTVPWKVWNGIKAKQHKISEDGRYGLTIFFKSKKHIYSLFVASRTGETADMKRFLDSIRFNPDSKEASTDIKTISKLRGSPVNVTTATEPYSPPAKKPKAEERKDYKPLVVLFQPHASYLDSARLNNVQGGVMFRLSLSVDGAVTAVELLKTLPKGLARQSLFAALRMKFLPPEDHGVPVPISIVREYTFKIY